MIDIDPWTLYPIVFLGSLLFVLLGRFAGERYRARQIRRRLHRVLEETSPTGIPLAPEPSPRPPHRPGLSRLLRRRGRVRWLEDFLRGAGWRFPPSVLGYGALLLGLAGGLLILMLTKSWGIALPAALAGVFLPFWVVHRARAKRLFQINNQLINWLTVMSRHLNVDPDWNRALEAAARDLEPPLGEELTRLLLETRREASWDQAFQNLLRRVPSQDLELIIAALRAGQEIHADDGAWEAVLDSILHTVQERVRLQEEIREVLGTWELSALAIGLLPLSLVLLLLLIDPASLEPLLGSHGGCLLLGSAILLPALGGLYLQKSMGTQY